MISVRVTAAGAVLGTILIVLTTPARACDDRFIKKCEKQSEAAAIAEEAGAAPAAKRGSGKRVRLVALRQSKHSRFVAHARAPRFATRDVRTSVVASEPVSALLPQSQLARRFRGFIDPQPIAENAFEALRKPHAIALDFDAAAIAPAPEVPDTGEAVAVNPAPVTPVAAVATTPKQDRLAAKPVAAPPARPVAQMQLAAAESRPVVLADAVAAAPAVAMAAVTGPAMLAEPVIMTESPPPADGPRKPFSFHGLVLALCGALGAASALRFIVGA